MVEGPGNSTLIPQFDIHHLNLLYIYFLQGKAARFRILELRFVVNLVEVTVEDRQVQHICESNATSAALAPNIACHKCLARLLDFNNC